MLVNYSRWDRFVANVDANRTSPLGKLVGDDELFREPETAVDSYAQAWAWTYFLIKWHPKEYVAYLKSIKEQQILGQPDPKRRVAEFKKYFGSDYDTLEDDFFRKMRQIE